MKTNSVEFKTNYNYFIQLAAVEAKQRRVASSSTVNHVIVNLKTNKQKCRYKTPKKRRIIGNEHLFNHKKKTSC